MKYHLRKAQTEAFYKELLQPYTEQLLSSREIAEATGLKQKHVQKLLKKYDLPRQKQGDSAKGERNYFWTGGKTIDKHGYILLKRNDHPYCNSGGYVREHRLVMEEHLGRYLLPTEVVHHKNSVRHDNRIENLEVFSSNGKHLQAELTGRCPQWTPEGKARILQAVRRPRGQKVASIQTELETDVLQ